VIFITPELAGEIVLAARLVVESPDGTGATLVCLRLVIIKVLIGILVLSAAALIGVAAAVFVRVRWHCNPRRAQAANSSEATHEIGREGLL
jgi:hypothetical protein